VDWSDTNILGVGLASCVYLWSAETSQVTKLTDLTPEDDSITALNWVQHVSSSNCFAQISTLSPPGQGSTLAIGTRRGFVHIWDANACTKIRTMVKHGHRVGSLSWSGHTLASGSKDHTIRLCDTRSAENSFRELNGHKYANLR
jgi:cell division cycle 20-like protein 1 (cofactor of APC complex)